MEQENSQVKVAMYTIERKNAEKKWEDTVTFWKESDNTFIRTALDGQTGDKIETTCTKDEVIKTMSDLDKLVQQYKKLNLDGYKIILPLNKNLLQEEKKNMDNLPAENETMAATNPENEKDKIEWVTISLSEKQILKNPVHNEKNGKDYLRIIAPNGGIIFYPADGLKKNSKNNRISFTRPKGTELPIKYGVKNEQTGEWDNKTHIVTIEDLKDMYDAELQSLKEQRQLEQDNGTSTFVNFTVPTSWGQEFTGKSDEKKYVSISFPIMENDAMNYYSFILSAEQFKASDREPGMSYFGFPRKRQDSETDFTVKLVHNYRKDDGDYGQIEKIVTSTELKGFVDAAVKAHEVSKNFVGIEISEKLIHPFEAKDKKEFISVSVPVMYDVEGKPEYWQIVVTPDRIRESQKDGMVYLSLFKQNKDGEIWVHVAKHSELNPETNQYDTQEMKFTSEEIITCFRKSKENFYDKLNSSQRTMQDDINESRKNDNSEPEQSTATQRKAHRQGR
ncbi:MAG: DUF4365 domain-containing protein [Clostridiales bacterium]|nr:DUF4365 domain-containing protein [Clostridiales bacterium]